MSAAKVAGSERPGWQSAPWHVLIPVVLSLGIGLWAIDRVGLWGDERETLIAIPNILWRLWEAPLIPYYTAMWAWTFGGHWTSDLWLRLPSVLCMAGAVGFTAAAAARIRTRRVGLFAGIALALMPAVTRYAQEVRVYALATLLVAIVTWLFVRSVQNGRRRWWIAYAITLAAIGVFAPFAYAVVPAHGLVLVSRSDYRRHLRAWLIACASNIPVVLGGMYLSLHYGSMHEWLAKPTLQALVLDLPTIALVPAFGAVMFGLALTTREGARWAGAVVVGMASLWLLSLGPANFWLQRSFIPLAPLLAMGAACGAVRLAWLQFTGLVALLAVLGLPPAFADREPGARGLDPRAFASMVDDMAQPGDVINTAINDWFSWGVARYSRHPDQYAYAPSSSGRAWVLDKDVPCKRLAEYAVPGGDSLLVLCESLPAGWENRVVRG